MDDRKLYNSESLRLVGCLIYSRLRGRKTSNLGIPTGADLKSPQQTSALLAGNQERTVLARQKTLITTTPFLPNTPEKMVTPIPLM